jgi:hypothetical protein
MSDKKTSKNAANYTKSHKMTQTVFTRFSLVFSLITHTK